MMRSGERVLTGTGAARRRLTVEEAQAGGLPEPFTHAEWAAMAQASRPKRRQSRSAKRRERDAAIIASAIAPGTKRSATAVAAQVGCNPKTAATVMRRHGLPIRPRRVFTAAERERIKTMRSGGYTYRAIAEALGRTLPVVAQWCARHPLEVSTPDPEQQALRLLGEGRSVYRVSRMLEQPFDQVLQWGVAAGVVAANGREVA